MSNFAFPNAYEVISDTAEHTPPLGSKGPYLGFILHSDTVFDEIVAVGATYNAAAALELITDVPVGTFFPLRILSTTLSAGKLKLGLPG